MRFDARGFRLFVITAVAVVALMLLPETIDGAGTVQDNPVNTAAVSTAMAIIESSRTSGPGAFPQADTYPSNPSSTTDMESKPKEQENLLANPGFEDGLSVSPVYWTPFGDAAWVQDEVFSGQRAVRVSANGDSSGITSALFVVPENSRVEFKVAIKASNVAHSGGFHRLRLTPSAYAADQVTRIRHWDMAALTGDTGWREFRGTIIAPPGTHYMTLTAQLTNTSGAFWIDQVSATIVQRVPMVNLSQVSQPVIIPAPAQISAGDRRLPLQDLWIHVPGDDSRFLPALLSYLDEIRVVHSKAETYPVPGDFHVLIAGDSSLPALNEQFRRAFPNFDWDDLGEQGYFLSVQQAGERLRIYIGANSEQGRFYGLQTLRQVIDSEQKILVPVDILDYPSLPRRGVMMGLHWYNEREEAFHRMAELKLNFVWNQGSAVNDKFRFRWREPLNETEKDDLREYLALAQSNFIDPYISISPKGTDLVDAPIYSSEADIQAVVNKMEDLYALGFRRFGLSFDDLSNYGLERLYGQDAQRWGSDIGLAHLYFIGQVYTRMKQSHPDIYLMVVPMNYSGIINSSAASFAYLQTLSRLPVEIELFTALEYVEEMEIVSSLTGRPHVMMDNFWSRFYREQKPDFVLPLDRPTHFREGLIRGYAFLPSIPKIEDDSLMSWRTAAEYAWAPGRYHVEDAFQRAVYRHLRD